MKALRIRVQYTALSILIVFVLAQSVTAKPSHPAIALAITDTLGAVWQEVKGNPKLAGVQALSWRAAGCTDPALVRAPDGTLTVWFTTMGIRKDAKGKFAADGPWIGRAVGKDTSSLKFKFIPDQPVITDGLEGSWDRYVETLSVLHDDKADRYIAWYAGYRERGGPTGFVDLAIGQMYSLDKTGIKWARPPAPIYRPKAGEWDGVLVSGPTVVQGPDKIWRLYYTGIGTTGGVGLLTSKDGVIWTPHGSAPVLEVAPGKWDSQILEQAVLYAHGKYWLWYSGLDSPLSEKTVICIGLATSDDGIHWKKHPNNPILKPGPQGSWNDARVVSPSVIVEPDGSFLLAAHGQSRKDIKENRSAGVIGFWRSR